MVYVNRTTVLIYESTSHQDLRESVASWCRAVAENLHDRAYSWSEDTAVTLSGFISFGKARRLELDDQERWLEEAREQYIAESGRRP